MARLWVSQNIKALWEEHFKAAVGSRTEGTLVVATSEQKQAIKEMWIKEKGGIFGWNVLTYAQAQRKESAIGRWELEVLAKTIFPNSLWPAVNGWAWDVFAWVGAGYDISEIPFDAAWKERTREVFKRIAGKKLTAQVEVYADLALGFDPLEVQGIRAHEWGLVVESEEVTPAQMTCLAAMEAHMGAAVWCDMGERKKIKSLCVGGGIEIFPAVSELLLEHPQIQRVVWQGEVARAALVEIGLGAPSSGGQAWTSREIAGRLRELHEKQNSFSARLHFWRQRVAHAILPWADEVAAEKLTAERWEKEGKLAGMDATEFLLPAEETPEAFALHLKKILAEDTDADELVEKLSHIKALLPAKISRELWLELLQMPAQEDGFYAGLRSVNFEKAQGLIDDETLVVWSALPPAGRVSLLDADELRRRNAQEFKEGATPAHGYIETDLQRKSFARRAAAQRLSPWVLLASSAAQTTQDMDVHKRVYVAEGGQKKTEGALTSKHAERKTPKQKFGRFDHALPTPVRMSCKQWEGALLAPELMWYEANKLRQLWPGAARSPVALWIGNWVHAAMKAGVTTERVNEFFENAASVDDATQLMWHEARAQAWQVAYTFAKALEDAGAKIVASELPVSGDLETGGVKIPLTGRIDAVVELPGGQQVIVDFKTSASATPLTHKKMESADGLQLWLYGRLYKNSTPMGLCRLAVGKKMDVQLLMEEKRISAEEHMAQVAQTGILGLRGWVWGRFGGENRLPLAALPVDWRVIEERRKETYGRAD